MKLESSKQIFEKKVQISSFIKICPVGADLFHADTQTDKTKRIVAFRNFANAPKNGISVVCCLCRVSVLIYLRKTRNLCHQTLISTSSVCGSHAK